MLFACSCDIKVRDLLNQDILLTSSVCNVLLTSARSHREVVSIANKAKLSDINYPMC